MQPTFASPMLPDVRKFWFCGETLAPEVAAELLRRFPGAEVWNTYGPTEATVATTAIQITTRMCWIADSIRCRWAASSPAPRLLIRDEADQACASRLAGRDCDCRSQRRPRLRPPPGPDRSCCSWKFEGQRAYRTGDAGHFEGDLLFFEGRLDFQIKLHGYRIELGDIESNLHKLGDVQDAVVLPAMRDGRAEYLVAFAILKVDSRDASDFELSQRLRQELAEHLPDYMVPRKFIFLREFPTTPNGKVDRQKLAQSTPVIPYTDFLYFRHLPLRACCPA